MRASGWIKGSLLPLLGEEVRLSVGAGHTTCFSNQAETDTAQPWPAVRFPGCAPSPTPAPPGLCKVLRLHAGSSASVTPTPLRPCACPGPSVYKSKREKWTRGACWRVALLPFLSFDFLGASHSKSHLGLTASRRERGAGLNVMLSRRHDLLEGAWRV